MSLEGQRHMPNRGIVWSGSWALGCLVMATVGSGLAVAAESPSPAAQEALRLVESDDPYQREVGFLRLEALRDRATIEPLRVYTTDHDEDVRAASIRALAGIEGLDAVPWVLERLPTERSPRVRRAMLLSIEVLQPGSEEILPTFITALTDRNRLVRMTAVDIVSRIDDPRAREAIFERARREQNSNVIKVLRMAVDRMGVEWPR